jgi:hypothetical protein
VVIDDGNNGSNYVVSVADSHSGIITKAPLTVSVVNDAKFVTQADSAGYGGVIYNGFVAGETASVLSSVGSISRSNAGTNSAGTYAGALTASGWSATNYDISYQAGTYTIVPANSLLVRATPTTTSYGSAPSYNITAQYLASNGSIVNVSSSIASSAVSVSDGVGGSAQFALNPINGSMSTSNNLQVGGYNLGSTNVSIGGSNFNSLVVVGSLTVTPKILNNDLGVQSLVKVYDGSTSITGTALTFDRNLAGVIGSDGVSLSGSGSYNDPNVGTNKGVTISMGLSGTDARDYALSTTTLNANVGTITQLASVQYVGSANGSWSDSRNWAGGALPSGNNVANVIIPTGMTVLYNSDQVGAIGSQINNSGVIRFASANPFNLANNVSGSGILQQAGAGMLTISGNNSGMSGNIDIGSYALTLASTNALGTGSILSSGGQLSVTSGINLSRLAVNGAVTLLSPVYTSGDQIYSSPLTFLSSGTPYNVSSQAAANPNFYSSAGNISFMSTVSAGADSMSAQRNFVVSAPNGTVTINDQVGQNVVSARSSNLQMINFADYSLTGVNPYSVDIGAKTIRLYGDVTSFDNQQYRGAVLVGDNGSNGNSRVLLSMDPSINFTGSVDDIAAGQHTLMLRALTLNNSLPTITMGDVGVNRALAGLDILVGRQNQASYVTDISPDRSTYLGNVVLNGNVTTTNNQMYVGDTISLTNGTTMRSNLGTIEMVNGVHGSVAGLNGALFSFGLGAGGLGSNLGSLGGRSTVDPRPAPPVLLANNDNSLFARHSVQLAEQFQKTSSAVRDDMVEGADVQIGDLTVTGPAEVTTSSIKNSVTTSAANNNSINCDPKRDDSCGPK